ncbi:hypothetical protein CU097_003905, partial [Rhizopus azygosporus]
GEIACLRRRVALNTEIEILGIIKRVSHGYICQGSELLPYRDLPHAQFDRYGGLELVDRVALCYIL